MAEAQNLVEREATLPAGYYIAWGGEFENTQRAMKRLYIVVPLALLLIFLLLYSTFNSFRYAALIIANVPFALVGGVAAVWLRGFNLSLSTAVGFIALFGVAVLNGVVSEIAARPDRRTVSIVEMTKPRESDNFRPHTA